MMWYVVIVIPTIILKTLKTLTGKKTKPKKKKVKKKFNRRNEMRLPLYSILISPHSRIIVLISDQDYN